MCLRRVGHNRHTRLAALVSSSPLFALSSHAADPAVCYRQSNPPSLDLATVVIPTPRWMNQQHQPARPFPTIKTSLRACAWRKASSSARCHVLARVGWRAMSHMTQSLSTGASSSKRLLHNWCCRSVHSYGHAAAAGHDFGACSARCVCRFSRGSHWLDHQKHRNASMSIHVLGTHGTVRAGGDSRGSGDAGHATCVVACSHHDGVDHAVSGLCGILADSVHWRLGVRLRAFAARPRRSGHAVD